MGANRPFWTLPRPRRLGNFPIRLFLFAHQTINPKYLLDRLNYTPFNERNDSAPLRLKTNWRRNVASSTDGRIETEQRQKNADLHITAKAFYQSVGTVFLHRLLTFLSALNPKQFNFHSVIKMWSGGLSVLKGLNETNDRACFAPSDARVI